MILTNYTKNRAFTLIELLVVIGLIAVLVGGIGMALAKGGDRSAALQGGQGLLSSLLSGVRGRAALAQEETGLFVDSDPSSTGFLQAFRIAVKSGSNWEPVGEQIMLPQGIFLIPPTSGTFTAAQVALTPLGGGSWPASRYSTGFDGSSATLNNITGTYKMVYSLSARGTTATGGKLILAAGERTATGIRLLNPDYIRGATLSSYGVLTLLTDSTAFDN